MERIMSKTRLLLFGAVFGFLAFGLGVAHSQPRLLLEPLPKDLAVATKVNEKDTVRLLDALGPAVARQLAAGRQVSLPGLGTFRVVRLGEARNLDADGRVITQPATNIVEFVPEGNLTEAANSADAVPAVIVPAFQYNILPGQIPSQRVPYTRSPSNRVR
jgi:nucleoid DNA-binding protein